MGRATSAPRCSSSGHHQPPPQRQEGRLARRPAVRRQGVQGPVRVTPPTSWTTSVKRSAKVAAASTWIDASWTFRSKRTADLTQRRPPPRSASTRRPAWQAGRGRQERSASRSPSRARPRADKEPQVAAHVRLLRLRQDLEEARGQEGQDHLQEPGRRGRPSPSTPRSPTRRATSRRGFRSHKMRTTEVSRPGPPTVPAERGPAASTSSGGPLQLPRGADGRGAGMLPGPPRVRAPQLPRSRRPPPTASPGSARRGPATARARRPAWNDLKSRCSSPDERVPGLPARTPWLFSSVVVLAAQSLLNLLALDGAASAGQGGQWAVVRCAAASMRR
ncbi:hypothetical protein SGRIM128S_08410 [Streptomyces griseomycini]